jgi:hypothetical protein
VPELIVGFCGDTDMPISAAPVTVRLAVAETEPEVALIVAIPVPALVATPLLLMVATVAVDEVHTTEVVMSCELPSLYAPVAVNAWPVPSAMEAFCGAMTIDTSVAASTFRFPVPDMPPESAVMVVAPAPPHVAKPALTAVLLMVATAGADELQCTMPVMSCDVPSA